LGVLVLATAGLMAIGADTTISADLTNSFPDWTNTLQTLERSDPVQAALHDLGIGSSNPAQSNLAVGATAPDFVGIDHWLNSSPLTMAGLRGKVVLVDFWTYSCVNCIRTLPYLEGWYQKYNSAGLVIIGVHTPEFAFEHDTANVAAAIARFGITYPVAQDNEYATWGAYANEYWPADYLIDANGHLRATQFGEGNYAGTEADIRALLAEAHSGVVSLPSAAPSSAAPPFINGETGETYLGSDRSTSLAGLGTTKAGTATYTFPSSLPDNNFALSGSFDGQPQYITALASGDKLEMSFYASDVYLVLSAGSSATAPASVSVSGLPASQIGVTEDVGSDGTLTIGAARLYHLVHLNAPGRGIVTITFNGAGANAYAFTFGG
jgi:thiol-disulfide isomerase/thioredoxin